jgi:DNA-binding SARP family transcriptional activator/TolB-like protein/tetratricopeptide (TPR) repeat protein
MLLLHTLGELRLDGGSAGRLSSPRKELTLLTYLARRTPKAVGRGELAELLWGERDAAKARQSLRQALLELKRIVGDGLETGTDRVCLAARAVTLDAALFESDLAGQRWAEAAGRWRGEFLADIDDMGGADFRIWLEAEREGLRRGLRLALLRLIEEAQRNGAWNQGISWAERWVELLPLDEEGHQHLIELTQLDGRTADALTRHAAFRAHLRATDSKPTPAFVQLGLVLERHAAWDRGHHTPGSAALFTPDLVGRGPALAELLAAWESARAGTPASILVEGEAGIGKTRLCEEFLRQLATGSPAPVVLRGRGGESPEVAGHGLFSEMLAAFVSAPGLAGASPRALTELSLVAPGLRDRFPGLPEPYGSQPALEAALVEALTVVSEERPVVVYIDDLPRADRGSQRLLRSVMAQLSTAVLFLMTARTGDEEPSSAYIELASESRVRRLKLHVLGQRDVEALIGSMLELPPSERQRLARRLHAQGGGNPFYTIELTAAMVDEELLTPTQSGSWHLVAAHESQLIPLPATIREVVSRRLDRLSREVRRAVEAAAVLGRTFDADLIPSVSGLGTPASTVALEELIARRMVREAADSPGMYEFTHEIICRVAYDQLSADRREALHRSAAKAWQWRARRSRPARAAQDYHRARAGSTPGRSRWLRGVLIACGVAVLGATAAVVLLPLGQRASLTTLLTRKTPSLIPHRIVVAPLVNHTGDSALTGLGALAADWIAQGLMRTTQFEVVDPRTTALTGRIVNRIPAILRDRDKAIAIAEETGAGTVVSGDLFRDGDSLRVLMRVIDAATGKIIRAVEPVSGSAAAPSRLVANLRQHVLAAVASAVDTTSRGFSAALGEPPSYEAYVEVSKAWESFFRDDFADVFRRLRRATVLDSGYMTPLLMRAYVETRLADWPAVDTLVRRLDAHSATLTPAEQAVLAGLRADLHGDLWGRLRAARELMSLTPASVEGYTLAASSALFVNRPREALTILSHVDPDRGLLLVAPFYWVNQAPALHRLGDHRDELESARQGLRRFPDRSWTHVNLLIALAAIGDIDGLRREFHRATVDDPDPARATRQKALWVWRELRAHGHEVAATQWLSDLMTQPVPSQPDTSLESALVEGDLLSAAGRWTDAKRMYTAALSRHPRTPALLGRLGVTAAHLGDRTGALRLDAALFSLSGPYLFGSHTYARARIQAALGKRPAAVELLRSAWAQGRPLGFDDRGNDDVHSDPEFESLRDFFPFQMLMRTD